MQRGTRYRDATVLILHLSSNGMAWPCWQPVPGLRLQGTSGGVGYTGRKEVRVACGDVAQQVAQSSHEGSQERQTCAYACVDMLRATVIMLQVSNAGAGLGPARTTMLNRSSWVFGRCRIPATLPPYTPVHYSNYDGIIRTVDIPPFLRVVFSGPRLWQPIM